MYIRAFCLNMHIKYTCTFTRYKIILCRLILETLARICHSQVNTSTYASKRTCNLSAKRYICTHLQTRSLAHYRTRALSLSLCLCLSLSVSLPLSLPLSLSLSQMISCGLVVYSGIQTPAVLAFEEESGYLCYVQTCMHMHKCIYLYIYIYKCQSSHYFWTISHTLE